MASDSQGSIRKAATRETPSPRSRHRPKTSSPGVMATDSGQRSTAQRQIRKPVGRPMANSATTTSNNPAPATPPSQKNRTGPKNDNPGLDDSLYRELELNHPNKRWFNGYPALDGELPKVTYKSKDGKDIPLASLPVPIVEKGDVRQVGLRTAIQKYISFLLGEEAKWNPVTLINRQPKDCPRPLWSGQLYLGGIKDSANKKFLTENEISGVVSIHPDDWLAKEVWKENDVLERWDGRLLRPEWTDGKVVQCLFELKDESNEDLIACFPKAFRFIDYYLSQGKNVLVHCKMGQSRSASLAIAYEVYMYRRLLLNQKTPKGFDKMKASEKLEILKTKLKEFTDDISMPKNEPNRNGPRTDQNKRRGISTQKFQDQLLDYLQQLAQGGVEKTEPVQQPKPTEKKAIGGGGIIKYAALLCCYMGDVKPTREILSYWSSLKNTNQHYWIAAAKQKTGTNDRGDKYYLAEVNKFFEDEEQWRARQRTTPSA